MAKRGTLEHPKTKRLARLLKVPPGVALGLLETIWHFVGDYRKAGGLSNADIEDALDAGGWLAMFTAEQVLQALHNQEKECVWIDPLPDGRWVIHDWAVHCEDSIHATLYRALQRFADGTMPKPRSMSKDEREKLEKLWSNVPKTSTNQDETSVGHLEMSNGHTENVLPSQAKPLQATPFTLWSDSEEPDAPTENIFDEPSKAKPRSWQEIYDYADHIGLPREEAEAWLNRTKMVGWVYGPSKLPVKCWQSSMVTWKKGWKKGLSSGQANGKPTTPVLTAEEAGKINSGEGLPDYGSPVRANHEARRQN